MWNLHSSSKVFESDCSLVDSDQLKAAE